MPRNLPPRIHSHIVRTQRRRFFAAFLFALCLLVGAGAALAQTQLPQQLAATLKPIASVLSTQFAQLSSALSEHIPNVDLQLPTAQLAAASESATSFPNYIAEKIRNLFCRWLGCESELAATLTSRISNNQLTNIGAQQHATNSAKVNLPAPIPKRRRATLRAARPRRAKSWSQTPPHPLHPPTLAATTRTDHRTHPSAARPCLRRRTPRGT